MAASSSASKQSPPAQRYTDDPQDSEAAPLIAPSEDDTSSDHGDSQYNKRVVKHERLLTVLSALGLTISILALGLLIAAKIALGFAPKNFYLDWRLEESLSAGIAPAIVSLIICTCNLTRLRNIYFPLPSLISLVLDIVIFAIALPQGIAGLQDLPHSAYCYVYNQPDFDQKGCIRKALPARIIAGVALGMIVLLGVWHIILLVVRCIAVLRSNSWGTKGWNKGLKGPWKVPRGQLKFEISLKFLDEARDGASGAEERQLIEAE